MNRRTWSPGLALSRGWEVLRNDGPVDLAYKVLGEVIYRRMALMECLLVGPVEPIAAQIPVEISVAQPDQVEEHLAFRPELDRRRILRRLQDGHWCTIARHKGQIVHSSWTAVGQARIDYLDYLLELSPDEAYIYESYTAPGFRGLGISPARGLYVQQCLQQRRFQRVLAAAVPENRAAMRAIRKLGFNRIGTLGVIWVGPWRRSVLRLRPESSGGGSEIEPLVSAYWDSVVSQMNYRQHHLDSFLARQKRDAHLNLIDRWGGIPREGTVLKTDLFEEAVGQDGYMGELACRASLAVGMDISGAAAARARQRDLTSGAAHVVADVRSLPLASDTVIRIISPSTLDHFVDPDDLGSSIKELQRVLAPGGEAIVSLDNRQNVFDPLLRLAVRLGLTPYFVGRSSSIGELVRELEQAGLEVIDETAILHNPRFVATGLVFIARTVKWRPFTTAIRWVLTKAQKLEQTGVRYRTGCFVAARAVKPRGSGDS